MDAISCARVRQTRHAKWKGRGWMVALRCLWWVCAIHTDKPCECQVCVYVCVLACVCVCLHVWMSAHVCIVMPVYYTIRTTYEHISTPQISYFICWWSDLFFQAFRSNAAESLVGSRWPSGASDVRGNIWPTSVFIQTYNFIYMMYSKL